MPLQLSSKPLFALAPLAIAVAAAAANYPAVPSRQEASAREERPQTAVLRYFDAVSRGDCVALQQSVAGLLAGELQREGCSATLSRLRKHAVKYLRSEAARPDGRDEHAFLVPVQLEFAGKTMTSIVRVVRRGGSFKLATL
jgi:hypothetical protein